jgi:glycosyltransferase involved in cell wall biosynthesis
MVMSRTFPFVSVIIPCRNEEKFIGETLRNIIDQDYGKGEMEVFVVDGDSTDRTKEIAKQVSAKYSFIKVLTNAAKIVPNALNLAIRESKGEVIVRMDAHSVYPDNYISSLVNNLYELNADNVGGVWITEPGNTSVIAKAIAMATAHPFGIGNAQYRLGGAKPMQVDTVPFGCYRKEVFEKIGFFDEELVRNQDDEFNGRLIKNGGKIFLIPSVKIRYFARENVYKLSSMFFQYGLFKPLVNLKLKFPATIRQLIPPLFVVSLTVLAILSFFYHLFEILLVAEICLYVLLDIFVSAIISTRKDWKIFIPLLAMFPIIHFSYGIGYLKGLIRFALFKKHKKGKASEIMLSR